MSGTDFRFIVLKFASGERLVITSCEMRRLHEEGYVECDGPAGFTGVTYAFHDLPSALRRVLAMKAAAS